jgi:Protein of unknown function (DUF4232)
MHRTASLVLVSLAMAGGAVISPADAAGPNHQPAAVGTCSLSALRVTAGWAGAMGTIAGSVNLINRGATPCILKGFPGLTILDHGVPVITDVVRTLEGPAAGSLVEATELVPGQASTVYMQWINFCGSLSGPVSLDINFPHGARLVTAVRSPSIAGRPMAPRCGTRKLPSSLLVSSFQPGPDWGVVGLMSFYGMLNLHVYADAYAEVIDPGVSRAQFIAGYRQTRHVAIDLIAVPTYRVVRGDLTYECIGVRLTARQTRGPALKYGGWVMVVVPAYKQALVLIGGSRVLPNGRALVPDQATCAASIPAGAG